ncbi:hypothetical protein D3C76_1836060 [compost metagenome]
MMDTEAAQPQRTGQRRANGETLCAVGIGRVVGAFYFAPVSNAVRSFHLFTPSGFSTG